MKIQQIYTGCLAQAAYYIESAGEAAIIDPLRDVAPYIRKAKESGAEIKYIFETHFHADFVSGHLDLAKVTGAKIIYGPDANPSFPSHIGKDGEVFKLGEIEIELLHTPGHTLESSCYLLKDEKGKKKALFTGDTLFIGDVGRPDLAQNTLQGITQEDLASLLFDSLRNTIMPLPDDLIIYPAHGAGSACGKNMSKETSDTLGHQKLANYALRLDMSREEFIKEVTTGLLPPPAYFPLNVKMNSGGYESHDDVLTRGAKALSVTDFEQQLNAGEILLLDTRKPQEFAEGFIPGAINIGLDGSFAPWVGTLIPPTGINLLLVADVGREEEAITRLSRVGYDNVTGYLDGGFAAWALAQKPVDKIETIDAEELAKLNESEPLKIIDVRKTTEFETEHVDSAVNIPLDDINDKFTSIDKKDRAYVHCAGGYRSMIFLSILKARGYNNLTNVNGGYSAMRNFW